MLKGARANRGNRSHSKSHLAHATLEPLEKRIVLCAAHGVAGELIAPALAQASSHSNCNCNGPDPRDTPISNATMIARLNATMPAIAAADVPVAAAGNYTVSGRVRWTDRSGGLHNAPFVKIEIRERDAGSSSLLATTFTNSAGIYSIPVFADDGDADGNPDLFTRVFASSNVADVRPDDAISSTYFVDSSTLNEVTPGENVTLNIDGGNSADNEVALGIHSAALFAGGYAGTLLGTVPSHINIAFPTTADTSQMGAPEKKMDLLATDKFDWDVIFHEYGHYVGAIAKIDASPGGTHNLGDNLAASRGKDAGLKVAWSEGWATFFAIAGQRAMGLQALGIPDVGDLVYNDRETTGSLAVNLETRQGVGEDNEVSVQSTLWDLLDAESDGEEDFSVSDKAIFSALRSAAVKTVGEAWSALANGTSNLIKTKIASAFIQNKIAPKLTSPDDGFDASSAVAPPQFKWERNGGGSPNPLNDFRIRFYDDSLSTVLWEKQLGDVDNFTPTGEEWGQIQSSGGELKWIIEGKNTASPATPGGAVDHYWSAARSITPGVALIFVIDDTGSMGDELEGVKASLQAFIDQAASRIPPGGKAPKMQLITFKDSVNVQPATDDFNTIRSQVGALAAAAGGDCPEASPAALSAAIDNLAVGGTILFATDASASGGPDMGSMIERLRSKQATLNAILTGDCGPIGSGGSGAALPAVAMATGGAVLAPVLAGIPKPGDGGEGGATPNEPPRVGIDDPGQPIFDLHGDDFTVATPISADGSLFHGVVDPNSLIDYFVLDAIPRQDYEFRVTSDTGSELVITQYGTDGETSMDVYFDDEAQPGIFTAPETGRFYIRVAGNEPNATAPYSLSIIPRVASNSSVQLFSTIAAQSGGTFSVHDEVKLGEFTGFRAAILNTLLSTLGPSVITSSNSLTQGQTMAITLNGRKTNWRADATSIEFAGAGINVNSIEVTSPTSLTAIVTIAGNASPGFRNVTVRTQVGSTTETAVGQNVVEVTDAPDVPTTLSVEPGTLKQGASRDILIRGINTNWTDNVTVQLGGGVTVNSVTVLSPTQLQVNVTVASDAAIGFRTASITDLNSGTLSKQRALFIQSGSSTFAQITSLSVATISPGAPVTVEITGSNTHFAAGTTVANFGAGINVISLTINSETSATAVVEATSSVAGGFRNVTLSTAGESAVAVNSLFVENNGLVSVTIDPVGFDGNSMNEGTSRSFIVTARYGDGTTQDVTSQSGLAADLAGSNLVAGELFAPNVGADTALNLSASFSGLTATRSVTVVNTAAASGADLSGSVVSTIGNSFIGGKVGRANVTVNNGGPDLARGNVFVKLYFSSDGTIDASDTLLTTVRRNGAIAAGRGVVFKTAFVYPADKADGQYQLLAQIDSTSAIGETTEGNNVASLSSPITLVQPFVDYTATMALPAGIELVTGRNTVFDVNIQNIGNVPIAQNSIMRLVASRDETLDSADTTISEFRFGRGLAPDRIKRVRGALRTRGLSAGEYHIFFVTDATSTVAERNESNNAAVSAAPIKITDPFVDLAPSNLVPLTASIVTGRNSAFSFNLTNNGNVPVGGSTMLRLVMSTDNVLDGSDSVILERRMGLGIRNGQTKLIRSALPTRATPAGTYYVFAQLDSAATLTESDETNNVAISAAPITISDPFVDLEPSSLTPSGSTIPLGRNTAFSFLLANNGNVPLGGSTLLRFVASTDAVFDDADTVISESRLGLGLRAGQQKLIRGTLLTRELPAGSFYLFAVLDPANTVVESVETNNVTFSALPITVA